MNTTEKVKALLHTCKNYELGKGEYSAFIQDLERSFPEIAQSYLELLEERDRYKKALEEAKIDCEGTVTEAGTSFKETDLYDIICEALLNE